MGGCGHGAWHERSSQYGSWWACAMSAPVKLTRPTLQIGVRYMYVPGLHGLSRHAALLSDGARLQSLFTTWFLPDCFAR